jgi:ribosomal protein L11 methyltransferase
MKNEGAYFAVDFRVIPHAPWSDLLISELGGIGFESFVETDSGFTAYLKKEDFNGPKLENVAALYSTNCTINWTINEIEATNWNQQWESSFKPVEIDNRCVVKAPFHTIEKVVKYPIELTPKMSFGTGHHQTTYLMLSNLLDYEVENKSVLDMGCGTAVLAILAKKMGAKEVLAIDNDNWAYHNSLENIALNHCNDILVELGDSNNLSGRAFNIILANINKNILLQDIRRYVGALKSNGMLMLSGFFVQDIEEIEKEAVRNGLRRIACNDKDNWATLQFIKP